MVSNPVQLRTRGVELELWQPGFELNEKIPVYVAQDGTFSATVFDGEYRLNTIPNNGPWMNSSDTLDITVQGEAVVDIPVRPYFVVRDPQITHDPSAGGAGGTVRANFRVETVNTGRQVEWVGLYVGAYASWGLSLVEALYLAAFGAGAAVILRAGLDPGNRRAAGGRPADGRPPRRGRRPQHPPHTRARGAPWPLRPPRRARLPKAKTSGGTHGYPTGVAPRRGSSSAPTRRASNTTRRW